MTIRQRKGVVTRGNKITAKSSVSDVMNDRREHGDEWQNYISDKFEELGISPTFKRIKDSLGTRIADYQYDGVWVEAKTFINNAEVAKIKTLFDELKRIKCSMVIMGEWNPGFKKHAKDVKYLRDMGIAVFEGQSQCDSFIIDESIRLNIDKKIMMATPISIPFNQLVPHPDNRDTNEKNIPIIKSSIIKNGFFTQINVVEHEIKEIDGEMKMTYMIFEGHTRYYSLFDLYQKEYQIPPVACILVPWITSTDIDKLHKMLITTNTTYSGWKLKNFITSHKGNLEKLNNVEGIYSYGMMLKAMNQAKKQKWGEANPIYLFSHRDSLAFDDMKAVKDGVYVITEDEYNEQILPLLHLMDNVTSKDVNGNSRVYNGTIIRDIIVDIRIKYNTNSTIKDNFLQFLGFCKMKFKGEYDSGGFPTTKETGQIKWNVWFNEYLNMKEIGLTGQIPTFKPQSTILAFA